MDKYVILICDNCLSRNYKTKKNKNAQTRLELKKYCSKCKIKTLHKETR